VELFEEDISRDFFVVEATRGKEIIVLLR